jgi:16S rRNA (guanine1207-N2)-methyltransferase
MDMPSIFPYYDTNKFTALLRNERIEVISKPGLPGWDKVFPSTILLAEVPQLKSNDHVLLFGSNHGALGVVLAHFIPNGILWVTDYNYISLEMTKLTFEANHISNVHFHGEIDIPPEQYSKFDAVFIQLPKGRKIARRWLLQANQALIPGGILYIAGANNEGIQSVLKDAKDIFGEVNILAYKKGNRLAQLIKKSDQIPSLAWVHETGIAPGTWIEFSINLFENSFQIYSLPGVFSYDRLDEGTEMLLSALKISPGTHVLDVGCGYGIIGLAAAFQGAQWVDLVDNNLLAVASSQENITLNHLTNARAIPGDLLSPIGLKKYDLILSNPPFHTGHAVDFQVADTMITQSYEALEPGGQIILVANRFIRYDRLIKQTFGNISYLVESGKYHVLAGIKSL